LSLDANDGKQEVNRRLLELFSDSTRLFSLSFVQDDYLALEVLPMFKRGYNCLRALRLSFPRDASLSLSPLSALHNLWYLELHAIGVPPSELMVVSQLTKLQELSFQWGTPLVNEVLSAICSNCLDLRLLCAKGPIGGCSLLTYEGARHLSKLVNLTDLDLTNSMLIGSNWDFMLPLIKLKQLVIDWTKIGSDSVKYFTHLSNLELISHVGCPFPDGAFDFVAAPNLTAEDEFLAGGDAPNATITTTRGLARFAKSKGKKSFRDEEWTVYLKG
jgi:hypothetical protein